MGSDEQASGAVHVPVLLERVVSLLAPALQGRPAIMVDATLGLGGHAEALVRRFPQLVLIGLDRDPDALAMSRRRLAPFATRCHLVHAVYDELPAVLDRLGVPRVHGILFDLGVSSMQLDVAERGFAYSRDVELDMRMDRTESLTAADVVNDYPPAELTRILREYGEERFAQRVVAAIVRERSRGRLTSSAALADLVRDAIPAATRRTGGHPAKRTFQALRIEVNRELEVLQRAIPAAIDALEIGGRMAVMAYQSLEDRIVKRAFADRARGSTPEGLPVELPGHGPTLRLLTRGAERAGEQELEANPRSAPVRLRAAERIGVEGVAA
ncbi:MAG TPA: 16S rRNA (cytosine(1402)-N(4))-methyltransferase RsmH [Mycobacteriales bacterium]|nr:16S rRNA (cytosine(1402)-N(4))-methyltransferase RsmH [Mycobacteriales bacterium]